jgi:CRISPR-associated protein Cas1
MTNRIIEISDTSAYVHLENGLVKVEIDGSEKASVPLEEMGVLLLSNPAVTVTNAVISGIIGTGGQIVFCGKNYLPAGLVLPMEGHSSAAKNYETQVTASVPCKKRIWKDIICQKIALQSELLIKETGEDHGLSVLCERVKSGDPDNCEGQAARIYWSTLFGKEFRRNRDAKDHNRYLNYAYTLLRACTARAICSAGLHPSFGIHHHNQYDAFRLADDLMEPYRIFCDLQVVEAVHSFGTGHELDRSVKGILLNIFTMSYRVNCENFCLFDALIKTVASFSDIIGKGEGCIVLPDNLP